MKSKARRATVAERARMAAIKELPCVACITDRGFKVCGRVDVHHLLSGNKRRGHAFTIPLGRWHHRGEPIPGWTKKQATEEWGPSLALSSKKFHATYGDDELLLAMTNKMLEKRP